MRLATLFAALVLTVASAFAANADVAGAWAVSIDSPQGQVDATLTLKQEGDKVTGTLSSQMGDAPISGTVKDDTVTFTMSFDAGGQAMTLTYTAKVTDGKKMDGNVDFAGQGAIKFTGTKK